jgi:uncharacterized membrane protein YfcA
MTFALTDWLILLPIAATFSALGTLVGLGGGVFMVPILVLGFGVELKVAVAAITLCLFPSALLSTAFNAYRRHIDYFAGITLEIPTIVGAMIGASLTTVVPVRPLEMMFAFLVAFMGWKILFGKTHLNKVSLLDRFNKIPPVFTRTSGDVTYSASFIALNFFGLFSGVLAGLFGIGGGIIKTPVMLKIFRMPARRATSTALFMILFTSATAAFSHFKAGRMNFDLALPLAAAFFVGSFIGNNLAGKVSAHRLEKILGTIMLLASLTIVLHAWLIL